MVYVGELWIKCPLRPVFTFLVQEGDSCKWTDDSQRLILESFDAICNSPSHIYHSTLPFSPSSSWLHESYSTELSQELKVVRGLPVGWAACSRTVSFDSSPKTLAYWKDIIGVGLLFGGIVILDGITGTHTSILSGHTDSANSLTFSLDGALLVSGSNDKTVKLWDIQTGGVIKTFHGHTDVVWSVSISPDCTTIASGSGSGTIHIWDLQMGECCCVIKGYNDAAISVSFSPTNSQLLISASWSGVVQQWDVDGHQIGPSYPGDGVAFSPDGTCLISWKGTAATVQNSDSGVILAKLYVVNDDLCYCCFHPNGRLAAGVADETIYVWDITSSDPHLIETFIGHTNSITSLVFSSSSLISASWDESVKFWQIGASSTDPDVTDPKSTPGSILLCWSHRGGTL
jgi:WD40 repeat protein